MSKTTQATANSVLLKLPDYALERLNQFDTFVHSQITLFDTRLGIVGKYIVSPGIRLIALVVYLFFFIAGGIIALTLFLFRILIQIFNSKKILILMAWILLGVLVLSPFMFIFGFLSNIVALFIWVICAVMYLILEYVADYRNVILPLHFTPMIDN